jgi:hypothetical protein
MKIATRLFTLPMAISLFVSLVSLPANGQTFLTNGLVAYYPFNGDSKDESGHGRSLTNNGAILTADKFGNPNSAYSFNGASSILIQTNETDSLVLRDSFTVSCWVNITRISGNYSLVRKDGDINFLIMSPLGGSFYVEAFRDGLQHRGFSDRPPEGRWCMLTASWDGTNFTQYVDGHKNATLQDTLVRTAETYPLCLGNSIAFKGQARYGQQ